MEEALELENRRKIFRFVSDNPGAYFREIQKGLELATGVLEYHLGYLLGKNLLSTEMDGKKRRYFVSQEIPHLDKKTLGLMRQKTPRRIAIHALLNPNCSFQDLLNEFEISKSTLSFHLSIQDFLLSFLASGLSIGKQTVYLESLGCFSKAFSTEWSICCH